MRIIKEVWNETGDLEKIMFGFCSLSLLFMIGLAAGDVVMSMINSSRLSSAPINYGMAQIADKDFSELKVGVVSEKIPTGSAILTLGRSHFLNTKVGDRLCISWRSLPDVDRMNVEVVDSSRCK
jgi:hypothetical protein